MASKEITVARYGYRLLNKDWFPSDDPDQLEAFLIGLDGEFSRLGISVRYCDLFEDIRRGVSRVAFAPEMIEPEGENKAVCHNCGCGC